VNLSRFRIVVWCLSAAAAGCSKSSPAAPGPASPSGLLAPALQAPDDQSQLAVMRPTLIVANSASTQAGGKLYEFQVSDRADFSTAGAQRLTAFSVVAHPTSIPEGPNGTTSYTPDFDLQPTTRFYWRARVQSGSSTSDWSATRSFNTPITGYSRAGELYDPLVNGTTVGTRVGSTTFAGGKGLRIDNGNSYVRYQLVQPIGAGEFSMEIEGLHANAPGAKLRLFSMMDGTGNLFNSQYLLNAQYRGVNGNPDNCISFKALLGDPAIKLEPDLGVRTASIMSLDPSRAYFWRGTWSNGFTLTIKDGVNGATIYNYGLTSEFPGHTYNPSPHFAYLGANNGPYGEEDGSYPGAVYRNVWLGAGPRPQSLGSALRSY
jgi:hypothetical protein